MGQGLTAKVLLAGYARGIFPMAESRDDPALHWIDPRLRGILPLTGFRLSRSLARTIRRGGFTIRIDSDFAAVVRGCAQRDETWINDRLLRLYDELHDLGFAHSVEVWEGGQLAGGAFGIALGGAFFGESMFSARRDASKLALAYLVDRLRQAGFALLDTQFLTPHLASLGGVEIPRAAYHRLLEKALALPADFTAPPVPDPQSILQRMTQTS